ncbi:hypothetical protein EJ06DRAFT_352798 [Trichodelitschia bisporula]|uniref:Uncharacterized protein n=1 Tax=Trichodelitschia bisporula TaxID=703511 RepID=A0A6G1I0C8_9PEZI|nr:hypothetical protein EJ06DRAFT_352798 [Trichodelitschia bisporula]
MLGGLWILRRNPPASKEASPRGLLDTGALGSCLGWLTWWRLEFLEFSVLTLLCNYYGARLTLEHRSTLQTFFSRLGCFFPR